MGGIRDAEAERDGQRREAAQALDERTGIGGERLLGTGDADARDGVDKALADSGNAAEALVGAGGCGEEDGRKIGGAHGIEIAPLGFFDGEVGGEDTVDAGGLCVHREALEIAHTAPPVAKNRVEIGEDNEPGPGAGSPQFVREREDICKRGAIGDGPMAGALDDRAVGEWVAERDAELQDIGAGIDRSERDGPRDGEIRIADGEVDDEAGTPEEMDGHEYPFYDRRESRRIAVLDPALRGKPMRVHQPRSSETPPRSWLIRAMAWLLLLSMPWVGSHEGAAYSVLTHQAIIDLSWNDAIRPLLLSRYPHTTAAELRMAHAFAYGGCAIQDAGYYPFSRQFFSNLTHYVRTGDLSESLLRNARDVNEYAFALGALSHYVGDSVGHADAINSATAAEYPKLAKKYGPVVTYENAPGAYVATEFSFDVDQLSRRRFAPGAYDHFVGLRVPRRLLEQSFYETYGLSLTGVMGKTGRAAILSYRSSVRFFIPVFAKAKVVVHRNDFPRDDPPAFRTVEPYLQQAPYLQIRGARVS